MHEKRGKESNHLVFKGKKVVLEVELGSEKCKGELYYNVIYL